MNFCLFDYQRMFFETNDRTQQYNLTWIWAQLTDGYWVYVRNHGKIGLWVFYHRAKKNLKLIALTKNFFKRLSNKSLWRLNFNISLMRGSWFIFRPSSTVARAILSGEQSSLRKLPAVCVEMIVEGQLDMFSSSDVGCSFVLCGRNFDKMETASQIWMLFCGEIFFIHLAPLLNMSDSTKGILNLFQFYLFLSQHT